MAEEKKSLKKIHCITPQNNIDPFITIGSSTASTGQCWKWGNDNLFPYALSLMSRRSTTHRRIINDKADYISGRGFAYDERNKRLQAIVQSANGCNETLRQVLNKIAYDKCLFGNAFLEIVTDSKRSFLTLFHQDASKCRLSKDKKQIILHHDWNEFTESKAKKLSLYPLFEQAEDGTLRSIIHYKDYEPMFENYGVPACIAGLNVSAIAYKTDKWNISRLDNSFQLSGVMVPDGSFESEDDVREVTEKAEQKFAGKPGQVMFMIKENTETEGSKFIPVSSSNEGDWKQLHEQATSDIVIAHSWFRSLSGLDYSTGFNPDRIIREYEIAINTVILGEQAELLEPIKKVLSDIYRIDASSLTIINKPPVTEKPAYMMIWEARKADGLDFDPSDPKQQAFLSTIKNGRNENSDNSSTSN